MAVVIDIIDRSGPSNKMCRQLQPKKTKVVLVYITAKGILPPLDYLQGKTHLF